MAFVIDVQKLNAFEQPLMQVHGDFIEMLHAVKGCQDAVGEGLNLDTAFQQHGLALEKTFNESVVPAIQATLDTLATSAENAEVLQKLAGQLQAVDTTAVDSVQVNKGVRPAAFQRG